jgi:hypothetical protein
VSGPRVATSSDSACNPECGDACNYTVLSKNQMLPGLRALQWRIFILSKQALKAQSHAFEPVRIVERRCNDYVC